MLQRIQTIYMLASVISILMMLVLSLGAVVAPELATFEIKALGIYSLTEEVPLDEMRYGLFFLLLSMMLLPLATIFFYKKRQLQIRLLIFSALLDVLFYAYFFLFEGTACEQLASQSLVQCNLCPEVSSSYQFVLYAMPAISAFCCFMAIRGVMYDIALLASADRLRPSRKN